MLQCKLKTAVVPPSCSAATDGGALRLLPLILPSFLLPKIWIFCLFRSNSQISQSRGRPGASPCPLGPSSIFSPLNQRATMGYDRAKGNNQGGVTGRVTPKRRGGTGAPANRHPLSSHSAVLLACPLLCYAQSLREWGHFSSLLSHKLSLSFSCLSCLGFSSLSSRLTSFSVSVSLSIFSVLQLMEGHKKNKLLNVRNLFLCLSLSVSLSLLFLSFLPLLPISNVWRLTQCVLCVCVC